MAKTIVLPPFAGGGVRKEKNAEGVPFKVGEVRDIPRQSFTSFSDASSWQSIAGGGLAAALNIKSPQAEHIRLSLLVRKIPATAVVRVFSPKSSETFDVSGTQIAAALLVNRQAGDASENGQTYWFPSIIGDEATLQIELPSGVSANEVDVALKRVSHLFVNIAQESLVTQASGSCNVNVACAGTAYDTQSNATARMEFTDGVYSYLCSGTLINNTRQDFLPYFLSANHCISTQTVASTLSTRFFYRSTTCGGATIDPASRLVTGGATLLYASSTTDTSFMKLNSAAPSGATLVGWSTVAPSISSPMAGVHHPSGDVMKLSTGSLESYRSCTSPTNGSFSCSPSTSGGYLNILYSSGVTEGGSSGSGAFVTTNGNLYLVGQLYGGSSSCTNPSGSNIYGRFDLAFNAALSQWLAPAMDSTSLRNDVFRFSNAGTADHFYTANAAERDYIIASRPDFVYEGVAFYAYANPQTLLSPVFRFRDTRSNTHFYTISSAESIYIANNFPWFTYEGIAWYAQPNAVNGTSPLYRLTDTQRGNHFYTASVAERDYVLTNFPQYTYEGVGFYVWTSK